MYSAYEEAHVDILKINQIHEDGPAFKAGLVAQTDYILGALDSKVFKKFEAISVFAVFIQENEGKDVKIYVYSSEQEQVRQVTLKP